MWGYAVTNRRAHIIRMLPFLVLASLSLALSCLAMPALAGVSQAMLNVDLKNPGSAVSQITFYVASPGIGTSVTQGKNPISVTTPPGTSNRFTSQGQQAGLAVAFVGANLVRVTLTPLRTWGVMDNIQFIMTVFNTNNVRIVTAAGLGANPPVWLNANLPATPITPAPRLPGFQIVTKDADFTLYNDLTDSLGVQDLGFLPNISDSDFDNLDLDALLAESLDSSEPNFTLPASAFADFPNEPDPDPGNVFAAEEQLIDPSTGQVFGAFAEGVETVSEPSTLALLGAALVFGPWGWRHTRARLRSAV